MQHIELLCDLVLEQKQCDQVVSADSSWDVMMQKTWGGCSPLDTNTVQKHTLNHTDNVILIKSPNAPVVFICMTAIGQHNLNQIIDI